jgi:hypothetical protein
VSDHGRLEEQTPEEPMARRKRKRLRRQSRSSSSGGEGRAGNGAALARRESLEGEPNPRSVVRGNPNRGGLRSKPSRPSKRRGRNTAAGNAATRAGSPVREWTQPS